MQKGRIPISILIISAISIFLVDCSKDTSNNQPLGTAAHNSPPIAMFQGVVSDSVTKVPICGSTIFYLLTDSATTNGVSNDGYMPASSYNQGIFEFIQPFSTIASLANNNYIFRACNDSFVGQTVFIHPAPAASYNGYECYFNSNISCVPVAYLSIHLKDTSKATGSTLSLISNFNNLTSAGGNFNSNSKLLDTTFVYHIMPNKRLFLKWQFTVNKIAYSDSASMLIKSGKTGSLNISF